MERKESTNIEADQPDDLSPNGCHMGDSSPEAYNAVGYKSGIRPRCNKPPCMKDVGRSYCCMFENCIPDDLSPNGCHMGDSSPEAYNAVGFKSGRRPRYNRPPCMKDVGRSYGCMFENCIPDDLSPNGCHMGDSTHLAFSALGYNLGRRPRCNRPPCMKAVGRSYGCKFENCIPETCCLLDDCEKNNSIDRHLDVSSTSSSNEIDNYSTSLFTDRSDGCRIIKSRPYTVRHEENLRKKTFVPPRIDLLLIGKTGNGKSATGNMIVGERTFASGSTTSSLTKHFYSATTEHHGRPIQVVDGLTVCDTRLDSQRSVAQTTEAAKLALEANPEGYHAFLLVLKYGNRFTREENDTVDILKKVLGDNFLRKYCILIMTCGDIFKEEQRGKVDKRMTFPQWCKKQDGAFKDLLEECDNRLILFDNVTKVEKVIIKQIDELMHKVDELLSARRYNNKSFKRVQKTKTNIITKPMQSLINGEMETIPEIKQAQVTNSCIETENLVSCEQSICQSTTVMDLPLDGQDSPHNFAIELKNKSEEYENLIKEIELIKKKQQQIEENYQKKS